MYVQVIRNRLLVIKDFLYFIKERLFDIILLRSTKRVIFLKAVAKPIQVIAYFNKDGSINPIRFKLEEDGGKVIKIERVLKAEQERLAGNIMKKFTCSSIIGGVEKLYEIRYDSKSYKWVFFKI